MNRLEAKNPWIFIIVGIAIIILAFYLRMNGNALKERCTQNATAVVIDYEEKLETDGEGDWQTMYSPIIMYNANGQTVTTTSPTSYNYRKYDTNTEVEILYNPDNVEEYIVPSDFKTGTIYIFLIIFGAFCFLAGIAGCIQSYLKK